MTSLTITFTEFRANQNQGHETHLLSIQTLQNQIQDVQITQQNTQQNTHVQSTPSPTPTPA